MIPILYESSETKFTSEGIGHLADAISCNVIENRNGSYELEMEYPVGGELFDEIKTDRIILAKPNDLSDPQPFDIYKISRSMDGTVTINAEHCSYRLSGIPVKPFSAVGISAALEGIKAYSAIDNPFEFWTDVSNTSSKFTVDVPKSARACLGGSDGSILDTFSGSRGCEFEFDRFNVKVHAHRGSDNGVVISYGKNLTDLTQEKSIASVYTGVLAYWKSNDQDDDTQVTGEVQYIENHESYPRDLIYVLDASSDFEEAPSVSDLNSYAVKYISNNDIGTPSVSLTVSFIALWQTEEYKNIAPLERVSLCDYVTIRFEKLGVDATAEVIKTEYDVLTERYNEIELGDAQSSFSSTLKKTMSDTYATKTQVSDTQSFLQSAISHASELLKGAYGGHIVIGTNADGQPNEIFIMDTEDQSTAVKLLRINMAGIGGSTGGINGDYNLAILIDGTINASMIKVGELDGNLIKANTIVVGSLDSSVTDMVQEKATTAQTEAEKTASTALAKALVTVNSYMSELQNQIDGNIASWFYAYVPTLENEPASNWSTDETKNQHLGDLFYDTSTGYAYRFMQTDGVYSWQMIQDSDITKALEEASNAVTTANSKMRNFFETPVPPYDVGDTWTQGADGTVMVCQTAKAEGESYAEEDWTDGTKLNASISNLQTEVDTASAKADTVQSNLDVLDKQINGDSENTGLVEQVTQNGSDLNNLLGYIVASNGILSLGALDSVFKAQLDNSELGFYESNQRVAYFGNKSLYITEAQILNKLWIGDKWHFEPRNTVSGTHLTLFYTGDE